MLKDGILICDNCGARISRATVVPPEGWAKLHNLCSKCFLERSQSSA